ncbi:hypothetical protein [Hahella sp. HN01]|nr:hypothetical protein [Hahella sp. HN01]MBU6952624.1 hypothetical protein [Hahella sp. HN01]
MNKSLRVSIDAVVPTPSLEITARLIEVSEFIRRFRVSLYKSAPKR